MPKKGRLRPTLEDLKIFVDICQQFKVKGTKSLHDIAVRLDVAPSALTACLKRLEDDYFKRGQQLVDFKKGQQLVARGARKSIQRITPAGRELQDLANQLLEEHAKLKPQQRPRTKINVGMTDFCLIHLLPGDWIKEYLEDDSIELSFQLQQSPTELLAMLKDGDIDFGLDGFVDEPDVVPFQDKDGERIAFQRYVVCSPSHRWGKAISNGDKTKVRRVDLKDESLAMRIQDVHPTSDEIPPGNGQRLSVDTYDSVLAFARLGTVLGIVPGFPPWLDPLQKERQISCVRITDAKKSIPSLYLPPGTKRGELEPLVQKLVGDIEEHLRSLPRTLAKP